MNAFSLLRVNGGGAPKVIIQWLTMLKNYVKPLVRHPNLNARPYPHVILETTTYTRSSYHPHLVQTLNKWSSKIQAVAPSVLLPSNRNAFSKTTQHIKSAPQLIDETLADHNKVLLRTRIYRGKESRLGVSATDEDGAGEKEDAEVFDDTDFYHQLLRDIIDARGNGTGGNDDWMAMQKDKKAKKRVDTKASKGRKLRSVTRNRNCFLPHAILSYDVHEKIQNFMVPVPMQGSWHEEQIDELFASLLGKGFENAMQEGCS